MHATFVTSEAKQCELHMDAIARKTSGFTFKNRTRASGEKLVSGKRRPCCSAYWIRQELHLSSVFFTEQL